MAAAVKTRKGSQTKGGDRMETQDRHALLAAWLPPLICVRSAPMNNSPSLANLRAGLIGTGFIGPVHLEAIKRTGAQVTAICGSTKSAKALADQWGVPEVYGDYDYKALLASPNV